MGMMPPGGRQSSSGNRTRTGRPKVKTGCTTCKIRRIKCDETKPHCTKCTSTGRKCDGYVAHDTRGGGSALPDQQQRPRSLVGFPPAPWNRLLNHPGTPLEHRYLVFFQRETAPVLAGYFDAYFWNGLLLQVGHSEPTIQHAMMAVASVHEQVEMAGKGQLALALALAPGRRDPEMDCGRSFALQQYNKAISGLNRRLSEGHQSEEITLMCCVLFICLEFLRGNVDTAISHLRSGLDIMAAWRARNRKLLPDEALPIISEPRSVPDSLVLMFSRLSIQLMLCSQDPPSGIQVAPVLNLAERTPDAFPSLQAARASLDFFIKVSLQFLRESYEPSLRMRPDFRPQLEKLVAALDRWSSAFDLFLAASSTARTPQETRAAANLRILNIVARIWLFSSVSMEQSVFDAHTQAFSAIVNLAATINSDNLPLHPTPESSRATSKAANRPCSFTFEMGIIPPLYFVALKCRVPSIRRAAVSLLETTMPRREGVWIASVYVAIARRAIQIEEEDQQAIGHRDEVTGEMLPPESRRLHDVKVLPRSDEDAAERKQKVTFLMKPPLLCGPSDERDEVIQW